jgi:hypothetical protein
MLRHLLHVVLLRTMLVTAAGADVGIIVLHRLDDGLGVPQLWPGCPKASIGQGGCFDSRARTRSLVKVRVERENRVFPGPLGVSRCNKA